MAAPTEIMKLLPLLLDFLMEDDDLTHEMNEINVRHYGLLLSTSLRRDRPRLIGYVEQVIPHYTLDDFKAIFRVSRGMFEALLAMIGHQLMRTHPRGGGRAPVAVEKTALVSLYYMGCQETIRKIGEKFELSDHSVIETKNRFFRALLAKKVDIIKWPQGVRAREIIDGFSSKHGFKAIGAIDGSHIQIRPPLLSPENYVNRKGFHSVIVQAVCDHDMFLTDVYVGWPGSVHDARVFRRSPLAENLDRNYDQMCPDKSYLLGDAAYPLRHYLLTPFKDSGNLSHQQKNYNFKHSSTRMRIEHAFGVLKGRWRRLKFLDIVAIKTVLDTITVGCLLHNLCLLHEDLNEFMDGEEEVNHYENMPLFQNNPTGVARRLEVMARI